MSNDKSDGANRPAHKIKMHALEATIWVAEGQFGPYYTARFVKKYKDRDGNWAEGESYTALDCLVLSKLADAAHSWMMAHPLPGAAKSEPKRTKPPDATQPVSPSDMAAFLRPLPPRGDGPRDNEEGDEPIPY